MKPTRDPRCFRFEPATSRRDYLLRGGEGIN